MTTVDDLSTALKAADAAGDADAARQLALAIQNAGRQKPIEPTTAEKLLPGAVFFTPHDQEPGIGAAAIQGAAGFNQGIAPYARPVEKFLRGTLGVGQGGLPGQTPDAARMAAPIPTPISEWLSNSAPPPQGAAQRAIRRGMQTVGANAPYAALTFGGAPAVAAAGRGIAYEVGQMPGQVSALRAALARAAQGITNTPGTAGVGELGAASLSGAGAGTIAAVAPGNPAAESYAELAAPLGVLGSAAATRRAFNAALGIWSPEIARKVATEQVGEVMGRGLTPEAIVRIKRARDLEQKMPGLSVSLGEATEAPSLVATQRGVESNMTGPELEEKTARYGNNADAVEAYAAQHAPGAAGGPDVVIDALTGKMDDLRGKLQAQGTAAEAAGQTVAGKIPATPQIATGATIRDRELALRKQVRDQMTGIAKSLGINDVDLPVPTGGLKSRLQSIVDEGGDFEDAANRPRVINDVLDFGTKQAGDVAAFEQQGYPHDMAVRLASGDARLAKDPNTGEIRIVNAPGNRAPQPTGDTTTVDSLIKLESRITDDLRDASSGQNFSAKKVRMLVQTQHAVDEFMDETLANIGDPALRDKLSAFRDQYKQQYIDRFNQGASYKVRAKDGSSYYQTPDERVAQAFWGTPSGARQFNTTFQGDATATKALTDSVLDDLRSSTVRDGQIQPRLFSAWMRKNSQSLDQLPAIKAEVSSIDNAQSAVTARNAALDARATVIDNSRLSKALKRVDATSDPNQLATAAIKDPRLMAQVMGRLRDQPEVVNAWRRMLWNKVTDGTPDDIQAMLDNPSLQRAMTPQHMDALRDIMDATRMTTTVPVPKGQAYETDPYQYVRSNMGTGIDSLASKLWAVESGRAGMKWALLNVVGGAFRAQNRLALARTLKSALYDPQVAMDLAAAVKNGPNAAPAAKRLNTYLINAGYDIGINGPVDRPTSQTAPVPVTPSSPDARYAGP